MSSDLLVTYNMAVEKLIRYDENNEMYNDVLKDIGYDLYHAVDVLKIILMRKVLNTVGDEQKFYKEVINELES